MNEIDFAKFDKDFILNNLQSKKYWLNYAKILDDKFDNDIRDIEDEKYKLNNIKNQELKSELMAELESEDDSISIDRSIIYGALIVSLYSRFETTIKIMLNSLPIEQIKIIEEENKNKINRFDFKRIEISFKKLDIKIDKNYFENIGCIQNICNNFKHEPYSYSLLADNKQLKEHIEKHYDNCFSFLGILYDELAKKYKLHLFLGD